MLSFLLLGSPTVAAASATGTAAADQAVAAASATGTAAADQAVAGPRPTLEGTYAGTLSFTVTSITPTVITSSAPSTLTVTGTMNNTGNFPLTDLEFRFQRGEPLASQAAINAELAAPSEPTAVKVQSFSTLAPLLGAHSSARFTVSVPITGDGATSLALTTRGVYPTMININAEIAAGDSERVGELHFLTTVLSLPAGPVPAPTAPVSLAMLWPIVDRPHLGVGNVFADDALAASITGNGRLRRALDELPAATPAPGSITLVIDPELLTELELMSNGYRVIAPGQVQAALAPVTSTSSSATSTGSPGDTSRPGGSVRGAGQLDPGQTGANGGSGTDPPTVNRARPTSAHTAAASTRAGVPVPGAPPATSPRRHESPRSGETAVSTTGSTTTGVVRTSTTARVSTVLIPQGGTVVGTGQRAAADYLARLRKLSRQYPVLVLPYSDPDAVALVGTHQTAQLKSLVDRGRQVAAQVLGIGPVNRRGAGLIENLAVPEDGQVDNATLAALAADGYTSAVLDKSTVSDHETAVGAVTIPVTGGPSINAAVADSPLLSLISNVTRGSSIAVNLNRIAAELANQAFTGTGGALVISPDLRWAPSGINTGSVGTLLSTLAAADIVTGRRIDDVAAAATQPAALAYPPTAELAQLPPSYLSRIRQDNASVGQLRVALETSTLSKNTVDQVHPDPRDLIGVLQTALFPVTSAAYRTDPSPGVTVLESVETNIDRIRAQVSISSQNKSYTLASSTSPLLVTVYNSSAYDVRLRVAITGGERSGLITTDPAFQTIPAGHSVQFKIDSTVSRSGTFAVTASLFATDGSRWGEPVSITVTSTAYGLLTIILISAAGFVLLLMVIVRVRQRFRDRPGRLAPVPGDPQNGHRNLPDSILGSAEEEAARGNPAGFQASNDDASGAPGASGAGPPLAGTSGPGTPVASTSGPGVSVASTPVASTSVASTSGPGVSVASTSGPGTSGPGTSVDQEARVDQG